MYSVYDKQVFRDMFSMSVFFFVFFKDTFYTIIHIMVMIEYFFLYNVDKEVITF